MWLICIRRFAEIHGLIGDIIEGLLGDIIEGLLGDIIQGLLGDSAYPHSRYMISGLISTIIQGLFVDIHIDILWISTYIYVDIHYHTRLICLRGQASTLQDKQTCLKIIGLFCRI